MSVPGRRSSLLNIDNWLDKCSAEEPDSMIYEQDYISEVARMRSQHKIPDLEKLYTSVTDTCTKIGLPQDTIEERLNDIDECIVTFLDTIQKDVLDEFEKLCQYKEELIQQIQKMLADLYLAPYTPPEDLTLLQHCKRLKSKFNELNTVKQKRMVRLQELKEKQTKHCLVLGIKAPMIKMRTDIPTEDELVALANAVSDLEKEERRRKDKYCLLREMIARCYEQLDYTPENSFEASLATEQPDYSESHMLKLSNVHAKLEAQCAIQQEKYDKLKARLMSLYDRLDVDQFERDEFFGEHAVCKPTVLVEMEVEIERYEELKRQNIGKFIEKIKDELIVEYEKCFVSQDKQDEFFAMDTPSEELLELYERELERMKDYYEANKEILEKFHKWRIMWKELIELEMKANDPNRFNNRGGQLLLEEKKRKTLQKGLPKIENELTTLNERYNITVFDTRLDEFIAGCWDELNNAKEVEKKERQRAKMTENNPRGARKATQPQVVVTRKTPTKRPMAGGAPTPSKMQCQRSILGTPSQSVNRLNMLGMSASAKKSTQKNGSQISLNNNNNSKGRSLWPRSGPKSGIPVLGATSSASGSTKNLKAGSTNGSDSALSINEQEFEEMILTCQASARKLV